MEVQCLKPMIIHLGIIFDFFSIFNGELLNYNRDQEVYKEYNNNRLLCGDIIRGIDMTKDKDEMLILALKAISLLIKDDYFGQRNLEKLN